MVTKQALHSFLRYASAVTLIVFGLLFIGNLVVDNPITHKFLRKAIRSRMADSPYSLSFEALDASVLPGGVDLYGVKLGLKATEDAPAADILEASVVKARVSWLGLVLGEKKLALLEFTELRGQYVVEAAPGESPKDAVTRVLWPPGIKPPIDKVRLRGSTFHFVVKGRKPVKIAVEAKLMGVDAELSIKNYEDMRLELDIPGLNFSAFDKSFITNGRLATTLTFRDRKVTSEGFRIDSTAIRATGQISAALDGDDVVDETGSFVRSKRLHLKSFSLNPKLKVSYLDFGLVGKLLEVPASGGQFIGTMGLDLTSPIGSQGSTSWQLAAEGQLGDGTLGGFDLMDSKVALTVDDDKLKIDRLALIDDGQDLGSGSGTLGFSGKMPFDFTVNPKSLRLTRLLETVKVKDFDAVDLNLVGGQLAIKGGGKPFRLEVSGAADADQLIFPTLKVPNTLAQKEDCRISVGLRATSARLAIYEQLSAVECQHRGQSIKIPVGGSADFVKGRLRFEVVSKAMDLSLLANPLGQPLEGRGSFSLVTTGDSNGTSTTLLPEIAKFRLGQGLAFDQVDARVEFNSGDPRIHIPYALGGFPEQKGYFEIEDAWVIPKQQDTFEANVEVVNLPASFIQRITKAYKLDFPYACAIERVRGRLQGQLFRPMSWQGQLGFAAKTCTSGDEFLTDAVAGEVKLSKATIEAKDIAITNGDLTSQLNVTFQKHRRSKGGKPRLSLKLRSLKTASKKGRARDPQKLAYLPIVGPYLQKAGIDGHVRYDFELEDNGKDTIGLLTAHVDRIDFKGRKVPDLELRSTIDNGMVNTVISRPDKSILGRLAVDASSAGMPYTLYLSHKMFDYRFLVSEGFSRDPRNYLYLDGVLELEGTFKNFWQSKGSLSVDKLVFKYVTDFQNRVQNIDWRSKRPFVLSLANGAIQARKQAPLEFVGDDLRFTVEPGAMKLPESINFALNGEVDGSLLGKLSPKIDTAAGSLGIKGAWSGSLGAPELALSFDGKQQGKSPFQFNIAGYSPPVTDVKGSLRVADDAITITDLSAKKGKDSRITGSGRFVTKPGSKEQSQVIFNVKGAEFRGMSLSVFKNVNVNLDGEIEVSGTGRPYKISGLVMIDRASSIGHFDIRQQLYDAILKRQFIAPINLEPSIFTFDLELLAKKSIFIRNRNMKMTLTSDLRLLGSNENPLVLGVLRIDEGIFNYKRDFVVERGDIIFEGAASPPDPKLDIVGVADIRPYRVQVLVNSNVSDPKVDFLVEPHLRPDGTPLSKFDVLTLLTSGRVWDNSNSSTGTEFASAEALSLVVGRFEQPIEKLLELSGQTLIQNVFFDTYLATNSERPIVRLNMPIHIHDDLNVVFSADEKRNLSLSSEYAINDSISLFGSFEKGEEELNRTDNSGVVGDAGMDLKFHFSFP